MSDRSSSYSDEEELETPIADLTDMSLLDDYIGSRVRIWSNSKSEDAELVWTKQNSTEIAEGRLLDVETVTREWGSYPRLEYYNIVYVLLLLDNSIDRLHDYDEDMRYNQGYEIKFSPLLYKFSSYNRFEVLE